MQLNDCWSNFQAIYGFIKVLIDQELENHKTNSLNFFNWKLRKDHLNFLKNLKQL